MDATVKHLAKEAKVRLKKGFWESSLEKMNNSLLKAKNRGLNESRIVEFYKEKVKSNILKKEENSVFYSKVKKILDECGEVGDILGRLADKEYISTISFDQRQRYFLDLSTKYREALTRYKKEKMFE